MSLMRGGFLEWAITLGSPSSLCDWCRSSRSPRQGGSGGNHRQHSPAVLDSRKGQRQPHYWLHHPGSNAFHSGLAGRRHGYPPHVCPIFPGTLCSRLIIHRSIWAQLCGVVNFSLPASQCQRWSTATCWQPRWWVWTPGWSTSSGW